MRDLSSIVDLSTAFYAPALAGEAVDLAAFYKSPEFMALTSGTALASSPLFWPHMFHNGENCYAYALGMQGAGSLVPGGLSASAPCSEVSYEDLQEMSPEDHVAFVSDLRQSWQEAALRDGLEPAKAEELSGCRAGHYPVAMVMTLPETKVDAGFGIGRVIDFHWYRRDRDGLWSHKTPLSVPRKVDKAGKLIADPQTATRGIYADFVGYFWAPARGVTP